MYRKRRKLKSHSDREANFYDVLTNKPYLTRWFTVDGLLEVGSQYNSLSMEDKLKFWSNTHLYSIHKLTFFSLFFGLIGVDRFYLNDNFLGILKLVFLFPLLLITPYSFIIVLLDLFLCRKRAKILNHLNSIKTITKIKASSYELRSQQNQCIKPLIIERGTASKLVIDEFIGNVSLTEESLENTEKENELIIEKKIKELATIIIYKEYGKVIYKRKLTALVSKYYHFSNYLLIYLANSSTDDANKLFFIDMKNNKQLFSIIPIYNCYKGSFEYKNNRLFYCLYGDEFEIGSNGDLVDRISYLHKEVSNFSDNSLFYIECLIEETELTKYNIGLYIKYIRNYISFLEGTLHFLEYLAEAYSLQGDLLLKLEDLESAYYSYKLSNRLKCKNKRKLAKLEKILSKEVIENISISAEDEYQRLLVINNKVKSFYFKS
ncbi:hypothetical protein EV694_1691 [Volucribacter psittacicida]|uniref:TM2 domain-containing protein n=1 Tax=Volucribacter psittacicida TaxID=203482 RepID=A0A4R1FPR7_9PAST|nr:TM2 domain-containing protein [Volucribacter psittacicida]TCJ96140.1 hypothetical protein EV694_1691 [Volucribacter psittacicida]